MEVASVLFENLSKSETLLYVCVRVSQHFVWNNMGRILKDTRLSTGWANGGVRKFDLACSLLLNALK